MANIDIQEKRGPGAALWWVIGIIILAIVLWLIFGRRNQPATSAIQSATPVALAPAVAPPAAA